MIDIRRPNITGNTVEAQMSQVKNYLYQLSTQLNLALKSAEDEEKKRGYSSAEGAENPSNQKTQEDLTQETFFAVKNLIIKSADIVNFYYETIERRLVGEYEALSDYGIFKQKTEANLLATSTGLTQHYESIQQLENELKNISELRKDSCYIKTGWLDDGETIAGVEIGRTSQTTGGTDTAFARFTTDELAFFDPSGTKIAWFAKYKLNIQDAKIKGNLELGGFILDTSNGIAFKWVGED